MGETEVAGQARMTLAIESGFGKALKRVRAALKAGELEIVGEMDVAAASRCRVLLVDCPLLVFEGLALDRAAGVYFPVHVVLTEEGARTEVSTMTRAGGARMPAGAARPVELLEERVAAALATLANGG